MPNKPCQFECRTCGKIFWMRVENKDVPASRLQACPACHSVNLERLFPRVTAPADRQHKPAPDAGSAA